MIIDELIAILGYDVRGEGELRKFNDGLNTAEKKAQAVANRINAVSVAVGSFAGTVAANLAMTIGRAIGSLPGEMTSAAADFESLMTAIQKKAGATAEEMEAVGREVLDLSMGGELASTIDEIAAAYERGAAAGLPLDELREFAELSTKAADAFEMSAEATGNAFVGFQKVLGVEGGDLERVADLINYLADSGIADERDIVAFMDSAGALAKTVGFSVEETAALAAALVNLKVPAGEAATAMNSVLTKLIAPQAMSKGARAAFQAVAGDVNAFAKSMSEDADQALVGLLEKLSELDSSARAGAIAEIFGLNHADVVQQLVSGVDELKRNLAEAKNEAAWLGSLQNTYAMKLDDFWSKSTRFWNNTRGVMTMLGERTLPIFGEGLDMVSDFIHRIAFDGSLTSIADGFETSMKSARDFGRNMWRAGSFVFDAASAVTDLVSRVTGLNKVAASGLLGVAALGTTATGRAGMKWLAARFPAVAGILLLEDLIAGLSGDDSYIGSLDGGQEALDSIRQNASKLATEIRNLTSAFDGLLAIDFEGFTWAGFIGDEVVRFVRELNAEIEKLKNGIQWVRENVIDPVGEGIDRIFGADNDQLKAAPVLPEVLTGDDETDPYRPVHGGIIREAPRDQITYAPDALDRIAELKSGLEPTPEIKVATPLVRPEVEQPLVHPTVDVPTARVDVDRAVVRPEIEQPTIRPKVDTAHATVDVDPVIIRPTVDQPTVRPNVETPTVRPVVDSPRVRPEVEQPVIPSPFDLSGIRNAIQRLIDGASSIIDQAIEAQPIPARAAAANAEGGNFAKMLENFQGHMAKMSAVEAGDTVLNDNIVQQDNRQFPVSVNTTVNQTVQQATQAPAAAARATGDAVGRAAVQQRTQLNQEPSF